MPMENRLKICPNFWSSQTSREEEGGGGERPWKSESVQFLQQSCPDIAFNDEETVTIFPPFLLQITPFFNLRFTFVQTFVFIRFKFLPEDNLDLHLFQISEAARGGAGGRLGCLVTGGW